MLFKEVLKHCIDINSVTRIYFAEYSWFVVSLITGIVHTWLKQTWLKQVRQLRKCIHTLSVFPLRQHIIPNAVSPRGRQCQLIKPYYTVSWELYFQDIMLPNITHKSRNTLYLIYYQPLPCSTGLRESHRASGTLHKSYFTIISFSTREESNCLWHFLKIIIGRSMTVSFTTQFFFFVRLERHKKKQWK